MEPQARGLPVGGIDTQGLRGPGFATGRLRHDGDGPVGERLLPHRERAVRLRDREGRSGRRRGLPGLALPHLDGAHSGVGLGGGVGGEGRPHHTAGDGTGQGHARNRLVVRPHQVEVVELRLGDGSGIEDAEGVLVTRERIRGGDDLAVRGRFRVVDRLEHVRAAGAIELPVHVEEGSFRGLGGPWEGELQLLLEFRLARRLDLEPAREVAAFQLRLRIPRLDRERRHLELGNAFDGALGDAQLEAVFRRHHPSALADRGASGDGIDVLAALEDRHVAVRVGDGDVEDVPCRCGQGLVGIALIADGEAEHERAARIDDEHGRARQQAARGRAHRDEAIRIGIAEGQALGVRFGRHVGARREGDGGDGDHAAVHVLELPRRERVRRGRGEWVRGHETDRPSRAGDHGARGYRIARGTEQPEGGAKIGGVQRHRSRDLHAHVGRHVDGTGGGAHGRGHDAGERDVRRRRLSDRDLRLHLAVGGGGRHGRLETDGAGERGEQEPTVGAAQRDEGQHGRGRARGRDDGAQRSAIAGGHAAYESQRRLDTIEDVPSFTGEARQSREVLRDDRVVLHGADGHDRHLRDAADALDAREQVRAVRGRGTRRGHGQARREQELAPREVERHFRERDERRAPRHEGRDRRQAEVDGEVGRESALADGEPNAISLQNDGGIAAGLAAHAFPSGQDVEMDLARLELARLERPRRRDRNRGLELARGAVEDDVLDPLLFRSNRPRGQREGLGDDGLDNRARRHAGRVPDREMSDGGSPRGRQRGRSGRARARRRVRKRSHADARQRLTGGSHRDLLVVRADESVAARARQRRRHRSVGDSERTGPHRPGAQHAIVGGEVHRRDLAQTRDRDGQLPPRGSLEPHIERGDRAPSQGEQAGKPLGREPSEPVRARRATEGDRAARNRLVLRDRRGGGERRQAGIDGNRAHRRLHRHHAIDGRRPFLFRGEDDRRQVGREGVSAVLVGRGLGRPHAHARARHRQARIVGQDLPDDRARGRHQHAVRSGVSDVAGAVLGVRGERDRLAAGRAFGDDEVGLEGRSLDRADRLRPEVERDLRDAGEVVARDDRGLGRLPAAQRRRRGEIDAGRRGVADDADVVGRRVLGRVRGLGVDRVLSLDVERHDRGERAPGQGGGHAVDDNRRFRGRILDGARHRDVRLPRHGLVGGGGDVNLRRLHVDDDGPGDDHRVARFVGGDDVEGLAAIRETTHGGDPCVAGADRWRHADGDRHVRRIRHRPRDRERKGRDHRARGRRRHDQGGSRAVDADGNGDRCHVAGEIDGGQHDIRRTLHRERHVHLEPSVHHRHVGGAEQDLHARQVVGGAAHHVHRRRPRGEAGHRLLDDDRGRRGVHAHVSRVLAHVAGGVGGLSPQPDAGAGDRHHCPERAPAREAALHDRRNVIHRGGDRRGVVDGAPDLDGAGGEDRSFRRRRDVHLRGHAVDVERDAGSARIAGPVVRGGRERDVGRVADGDRVRGEPPTVHDGRHSRDVDRVEVKVGDLAGDLEGSRVRIRAIRRLLDGDLGSSPVDDDRATHVGVIARAVGDGDLDIVVVLAERHRATDRTVRERARVALAAHGARDGQVAVEVLRLAVEGEAARRVELAHVRLRGRADAAHRGRRRVDPERAIRGGGVRRPVRDVRDHVVGPIRQRERGRCSCLRHRELRGAVNPVCRPDRRTGSGRGRSPIRYGSRVVARSRPRWAHACLRRNGRRLRPSRRSPRDRGR